MEGAEALEPEVIDEQALDIRRPDVPITVEEIAALGEEKSEAIISARVQIIQTLRKQSILQTHPSDWVLYKDTNTGRVLAFLEDKGCQRLMDLWGIEVNNITTPELISSQDGQSFAYSVMGDGISKLTRRVVRNVEGVRYSTERFATEQPDGLPREVAVRKAARANLEGRIVRNLAGLNGVPLEELVQVSGKADFEARASKGRGYGSQAERRGAQVQQTSEIEPQYQPKCDTCHETMKFIPPGKTAQGKDYKAFWSCSKDRNHKPNITHEQALKEAARMKAEAEKPQQEQQREPGDEG